MFCCCERDDKNAVPIHGTCDDDQDGDTVFVSAEPLSEANGADAQTCTDVDRTGLAKYDEGGCLGMVKMIGKFGLTWSLKLLLGCTAGILSCIPEPEQSDPEPLAEDPSADRDLAVIEVAVVESGEATVSTDASYILATEATISEAQVVSAEDPQTDAPQEEPTAKTVATEDQQPAASEETRGAEAATSEDRQPDASKEEESSASMAANDAEAEGGPVAAGASPPVVEEVGGQQKGQAEQ